jgi:hypothetical protein
MATQLAAEPETVPEAEIAEGVETAPERDFETEARAQGWRPREEFGGDEAKWTDAETFVKRGDEILPFVKKQNAHLKQKVDMLERTVKKLARAEQAAYTNALADLKAKQREAVETGDVETHDALGQKIDELRTKAEADLPAHGEDPAEVFDKFRDENAWYDRANLASASEVEVEARLWADRRAEQMVRAGDDKRLPPSEFFAQIAAEAAERFPLLKARAARPKAVEAVAGVQRNPGRGAAKVGANLPADGKDAAERYMRLGLPGFKACKTKAEAHDLFAKSYDWESK